MPNDSIWFSHFDWNNSNNLARLIKLDIYWKEISGYTFSFLDAHLENGLYVTIGLRQTNEGRREASMSVFQHNASTSIFQQVNFKQNEGFFCYPGKEGDKYCKGKYQFELGEWYQFAIEARDDEIDGTICRLADQKVTQIATFITGGGTLIKAGSSSGVALEHIGMINPCECKSEIMLRRPIRIDVNGSQSVARGGLIGYQKCLNSNIARTSDGSILLSHGGNTVRENNHHRDYIQLD